MRFTTLFHGLSLAAALLAAGCGPADSPKEITGDIEDVELISLEVTTGQPPPVDLDLQRRQQEFLAAWERYRAAHPHDAPAALEKARHDLKLEMLDR